ncbi:MAG: PDZ domain-containing protein, partial [Hyphomicrobiales bacterium]|nr:PDZ domain-containing protein [Hyphomicrobiales bacterium]
IWKWSALVLLLAGAIGTEQALGAAESADLQERYFVDPSGSDANPGSLKKPFKTLAHAQAEVRANSRRGKQPLTVYLREGTYYLDDTLVFTAEDSGAPDAPVTWSAYKGEKVVLSGGQRLTLRWEPYREGIFRAKTSDALKIDELFINGQRQHMARYPNFDPDVAVYNGYAADAFSLERAERWADPAGGYIHAMHKHRWGGYHYRITGKKPDNTVTYEGGWQNNRQMGMHAEHRYVENIFEELDAPGEWFHDSKTQTLYYHPPEGVDIQAATIEVTRLRHLIAFQGEQAHPVRNINLSGLIFRHAARTFMDTKEPLLRSDWTIYRGGAVTFTGAEDCAIVDCEFDQVGGNAVFVNNYNRRIAIRGTHIHGAGASGVCFVGDPDSVRNPLFEYGQRQSYADIDKTPGPKTDNYPADCVVEDSLIHNVSVVEKQATGVQISMSKGITVRHCSIYDVGRAGINISEGTFGGHVIEFCDVFDTVRETGDHGSFNSWGRDRFWHLKDAPAEELPKLALLDTEKTIIRNSRWRCDHGWDVDLDDGSSNYEIYNNLFLRGGLKLREGFQRRVYNNIAVNSTLHPHVWYENSMDVIVNNIWMSRYRPVGIKKWGKEVDRNMFITEIDRKAFAAQGCDANSVVGDPMFMDPAKGDYRVRDGSPALKIGFKNFPMDRFGVQRPELKSIAQVPDFPILKIGKPAVATAHKVHAQWLGATVKALTGEEFSAFGANKEDGGVALVEVPANSAAARAGLQVHDLIQGVNGRPVKRTAEFLKALGGIPAGQMIRLKLIRAQQPKTLDIPSTKVQ